MKRLAFLVIFFMMISTQGYAAYTAKANFVFGTVGSGGIAGGATSLPVVLGATCGALPTVSADNPMIITVYDSGQPSQVANREIMAVTATAGTCTAGNTCTFTVTRNAETPNCSSCSFAQGAKWSNDMTAGTGAYLPLPTPTTGCVLQSTDGVNYTCPETLNIETINDTVDFVDNSDNTKVMNLQLSGITTATTRTWTAQNKDCTIACTTDSVDAASVEGYDLGTMTNGYLCTADTGNTEIDCALQATNANTASTVVQRDGSGNFSAGTITAALTGNASGTASALAANGTNCSAGEAALGVDASGNAEGCYTPAGVGDVTGVGNCADGACLDGTSDGGTTISLYDGDSHKLTIDIADLSGDATLLLGGTYTNGKICSFATAAGMTCNADDDDAPEAGDYAAASIDGDDINSNLAGRSLTLTAASPDTLDADAELYTDTKCIYIQNPTAADDLKSIWRPKGFAATLTSIWAESDQTVTFMLQVDDGSAADVDSVDLAPAAGTAEDTSLNGDATMADGDRLDIDLVSVANTPTWVSICWTYTKDD